MAAPLPDLDERTRNAVQVFWETRTGQAEDQQDGELATRGRRAEVLGGAHMDGFANLLWDVLNDAGIPDESIFMDHRAPLPGYFRKTKRWDLIVVHEDQLLAAVELKSIPTSFGNNLNNRSEEALGSSVDLVRAFEEGAFRPSPNPWSGYLMLMADNEEAQGGTRIREPHFDVLPAFEDADYRERGELLCLRLLREGWYDGVSFLLSPDAGEGGLDGEYEEPNPELTIQRFVQSLWAHVRAHV